MAIGCDDWGNLADRIGGSVGHGRISSVFGKIKNPERSEFTKGKGRKRTEASDRRQRGSERPEKRWKEACPGEATKPSSIRSWTQGGP